jgi:hypothetical protein
MGHNLAVLEAKALYKSWNEDEDVIQLSTNVLPQQAREIVSSIFQRLDIDGEVDDLGGEDRQYVLYRPRVLHVTKRLTLVSFFLISVHQTILTFLHTTIEKDYLDYLRSDKPADALPFLALTTSAQFDIEKISGRVEAAIGIMSLVFFLFKHSSASIRSSPRAILSSIMSFWRC